MCRRDMTIRVMKLKKWRWNWAKMPSSCEGHGQETLRPRGLWEWRLPSKWTQLNSALLIATHGITVVISTFPWALHPNLVNLISIYLPSYFKKRKKYIYIYFFIWPKFGKRLSPFFLCIILLIWFSFWMNNVSAQKYKIKVVLYRKKY